MNEIVKYLKKGLFALPGILLILVYLLGNRLIKFSFVL